ncbi:alpha/beta hydrolase [Enterococcus montenegrensis]|uniref:alpha/beta fold hydrolase n=1 Tax=Enterococcus montenegrensis TaxID=3031993 RepID=UPI00249EA17B|nr:alpha/beta hydrolase [Enterococcus montenegrensis]WHA09084.1 alpha/beta hydrolase [Enterococcus montenegrensis]
MDTYKINTDNGTKLDLLVLSPTKPKAIVQIIHGALEYKERYLPFAEFLQAHDFVVVLSDNRGHGESVSAADPFGVMESFSQLVEDQVIISDFIQTKYPNLPLSLFGHSFGSIIARNYLQKNDQRLEKVVLTGTANYVPVVFLGIAAGKLFLRFNDKQKQNKLLNWLSGNMGVEHDWLSNNPANNLRCQQDKKMIPIYPVRSLLTIWEGDYQLKKYAAYTCQNPQLPILSVVGSEDVKITGGKKGLADTVATLNKIGYKNVQSIEMPGMKHEVLNEIKCKDVYDVLVEFLAKE